MTLAGGARLRELLAELAHEQWSGWMRYLFEHSIETGDGCEEIQRLEVERWKRQMNTPYADLSEAEKDSDRKEADRVLKALEDAAALLVPPQVGGDGPPIASCLLCGNWRTLAVWHSGSRSGVCEECRAKASLVPSSSPAPQERWQAIETAPKSQAGAIIVGYAADEEGYSPNSHEAFWNQHEQRWVWTSDPTWRTNPQPTHWMPLPDSPVSGSTATPAHQEK